MHIMSGNVRDGSESNHDKAYRNVRYWTVGMNLFRKSMEENYGSSRSTDGGCAASGADFTHDREGIRRHHRAALGLKGTPREQGFGFSLALFEHVHSYRTV